MWWKLYAGRIGIWLLVLTWAVGAQAASSVLAAEAPRGKLTVAVASFGFEATLPTEGSIANHLYWDAMYDWMFTHDKNWNLRPGLITEWKLSEDGQTWTLKVRDGVRFHDGSPLTADDIKFTIDFMMNPKTKHIMRTVYRRFIKEVKVLDPRTVQIHTNGVYGTLLFDLSDQVSVPVLPKAYIEKVGIDKAREAPIGTGPFRFVSRAKGQHIRFEAVEGHWRQTPRFKELELRRVPEPGTRLAMLQAGAADIIDMPVGLKREIEAAKPRTISIPGNYHAWIFLGGQYRPDRKGYNPKLPWLDVRVRKALNLAIDREAIARQLLFGEARPLPVFLIYRGTPSFNPSWDAYPYDPAQAKRLLAEAGYPNGFDITLVTFPRPGVPDLPAINEAVASYWKDIGVRVKLIPSEWGAVRPRLAERTLTDAVNMSYGFTLEPVTPLWFWNHPESLIAAHGEDQTELYDNLEQMFREPAAARRAKLAWKAGDVIRARYTHIPTVEVNALYVLGPRIGDWAVYPHNGGANSYETVTHAR